MSEDLIRRSDAIKAVDAFLGTDPIVERIKRLPSADRPQGEWIDEHEDGHGSWVGTCNQCGKEKHVDNYCPNCGARMKGADDE